MSEISFDTKKLGFGMMRLPMEGGENPVINVDATPVIDIEETTRMVDMFMENGFTYFDTAWAYPGSEPAVKASLVDRYPRSSYTLATKMAAWIRCKTREDALAQFERSLELTGAGYFDYYLMHSLGGTRTKAFDDFGIWEWAADRKRDGMIKHFGFSFHSTADQLDEILTAHPEVDFVQLQINYLDWESPDIQSRACWETARRHGKAVVVMEPVKGGMLATLPESVSKIFKEADPSASPASWAIRFAASLDGVLTVLSGMRSTEQMADNISYMKSFVPLSDDELTVIGRARAALAKLPMIQCTGCQYCQKVCPNKIGIARCMKALNIHSVCGDASVARSPLGGMVPNGLTPPTECVKCGACEDACPQAIKIRPLLDKAIEIFYR